LFGLALVLHALHNAGGKDDFLVRRHHTINIIATTNDCAAQNPINGMVNLTQEPQAGLPEEQNCTISPILLTVIKPMITAGGIASNDAPMKFGSVSKRK
jgi:hypothetical protein